MMSLDVSGATDILPQLRQSFRHSRCNDRDEIHIFPIAEFNRDAVYLEGHVLRAGRYAYKPGMKLTDLISSTTIYFRSPQPVTPKLSG